MPVARDLWWGTDAGVARGGGARGWQFLRRNPEFYEVWEACARERPVYEDAPFPIRRQSDAERGIGRFGLFGLEDPFAVDGPASPFWAKCCMQHVDQDVAVPIMLRCRQFLLPDADGARITAT